MNGECPATCTPTLTVCNVFMTCMLLLALTCTTVEAVESPIADSVLLSAQDHIDEACGSSMLFDIETYFRVDGSPSVHALTFHVGAGNPPTRQEVLGQIGRWLNEARELSAKSKALKAQDDAPDSPQAQLRAALSQQIYQLTRQAEGRGDYCTVFFDAERGARLHTLRRLPDHLQVLVALQSSQGAPKSQSALRYVFQDWQNQFYVEMQDGRAARELRPVSGVFEKQELSVAEWARLKALPLDFKNIPSSANYTVVITHGFALFGNRPVWLAVMADKIADRIDGGGVRRMEFDQSSGQLIFLENGSCATTCNTVIQVDWALTSNNLGKGHSEAAADSLFQALVDAKNRGWIKLGNLHFIGHSRGTVVNSETAERLLHAKAAGLVSPVDVKQVTTLDPHDMGYFLGTSWTDYDVNSPGLGGVLTWTPVTHADNYYSLNGFILEDGGLDGREVDGAHNLFLGLDFNHSEVWCWYLGTISLNALAFFEDITGDNSCEDYDITWFDRPGLPNQQQGGFNQAEVIQAGGIPPFTHHYPQGVKRPIGFSFSDPSQGTLNGNFSRASRRSYDLLLNKSEIPGWNYGTTGTATDGIQRDGQLYLGLLSSHKTHDWFYIPSTAGAILFRYRVANPSSNDQFETWLGGDPLTLRRSVGVASETGWITETVHLSGSDKGARKRLEFRINGQSLGVGSEVVIDDVRLEIGADTTPPQITDFVHTSQISTDIVLHFSEAMDPATLGEGNFTITGSASGSHSKVVSPNATAHTVTLNPNVNFANSETVTILVSTNVRDLAGNALAGTRTFSFVTDSGSPGSVPAVPGNVVATNGSVVGAVRVSWNGTGATSHKVYRGATASGSVSQIGTTGTAQQYDDTSAVIGTTYYYSVEACNANGCNARSGSDPGYAGAPSAALAAPTGVSAWDGVSPTGVLVSWNAVSGASSYRLYRDTSSAGNNRALLTSGWSYTSWADVNAVAGRTYWYWAQACNADGLCSGFSQPDSGYASAPSPTLNPPVNPDPAAGQTGVSIRTDLEWENGGGASSYKVYLGLSPALGSGNYLGSSISTQRDIPDLAYSTTYFWRVDALANGNTATGAVWQFTTRSEPAGDPPDDASGPVPHHLAVNQPLGTDLSWTAAAGATSYDIYFGTQFQPGSGQLVGNTSATSWSLPQLQYDQIYYWKIGARNAAGVNNSPVWRFSTEPPAPVQVSSPYPAHLASEVATAPRLLSWQEIPSRSQSYDIYFGTDPSPDSSEFQGNVSQSTWECPALNVGTTYYWQVIAKNNAGSTAGPIWRFTTWASSPGRLEVSAGGFTSQGPVGGPFAPSAKTYTVQNIGSGTITYAVSSSHPWAAIAPGSGSLPPGASAAVTVSIGATASGLTRGLYYASLGFNNTFNGFGNTIRTVSLGSGDVAEAWDVTRLAANNMQALAIRSDGSRVVWGSNDRGNLGIGSTSTIDFSAPVLADSGLGWIKIAANGSHVLGIRTDGRLYAWGDNGSGQLGLGDQLDRSSPVQVGADADWVSVSTGLNFSLALKSDGRLFAFGSNSDYQLGLGADQSNRLTPIQVGTGSNWDAISTGYTRSAALTTDGRLFTWGVQQGANNNTVQVPTQMGTMTGWTKLANKANHSLALHSTGALYSWGSNSDGELGHGDYLARYAPTRIGTDSDWAGIAVNQAFSLAWKADGRLYAWGANGYGNLGLGDRVERRVPTLVMQGTPIVEVVAGVASAYALLADGRVLAWGYNGNGRLGLNDTQDRYVPTEVDINWAAASRQTHLPGAPQISLAVPGDQSALLHFLPPADDGNSPILAYTMTASPGGATQGCLNSPCGILGLTNGVAYNLTVTATTAVGTGPASAASASVTPRGNQQIVFVPPADRPLASGPVVVSATGGASGNPVVFASLTPGVCTSGGSNGSTISPVVAGLCTVRASQAGNGSYNAATPVDGSFRWLSQQELIIFVSGFESP